jgi:hypothetical protein
MKRHCKSLSPSLAQPSSHINQIKQLCNIYLNQHTRQLGLDKPSFASPKEKQNDSNKFETQKSSSSDKKKNRTDRSDKKRKRTDASDFKSKPRRKSGDNKDKGKVPFGKHCRRPACKQRGTHKTHTHDDCRFKDCTHKTHSIESGR